MAFLSNEAAIALGFARIGDDVLISDKASFYRPDMIEIGDHVRIDDFCVLSAGEGGVCIGNYVHIAVHCSLIGGGRIAIHDFANLSSRVSIYSSSDDFSGMSMTNPMVPKEYTNVTHSDVNVMRHTIVGSGCVILPGTVLEEGVAVGALSLIKNSCKAFGIYAGMPAKRVAERKRRFLELESELLSK